MIAHGADTAVKCTVCDHEIAGVTDEGRLLDVAGIVTHADKTPHDTRLKDSGISGNVDLGWFTLREYELNEIVRDVVFAEGNDPDDENDPAFVPMPTLASAWESWLASTDEERVTYLRIGSDVDPLFVMDRLSQAERDLALALRLYGANAPLDEVFRCPLTLQSVA